jgi:alpha-tubulin suppressor-like RCC1 family protein
VRLDNNTYSNVFVGQNQAFFQLSNGTVLVCGDGSFGKLGLNDTISRNTLTENPDLFNITQISSTYSHTLAITQNGSLLVFGNNSFGQLGLGDTMNRLVPTNHTLVGIIAVSTGFGHSLALDNLGNVWAFGDNQYGQLGLVVSILSQWTPITIPSLSNVNKIDAGDVHALFFSNNSD